MAQPQSASQQQQPPDLAAITDAIGVGALLPPEAVVGSVPVGGVLTTAAAAAAVAGIISAFDDFNVRRQPALRDYLVRTLTQMYPERTGEDILRFVREELARDREFVRNQRDRLEADLEKAMTLPPEQRGVRVNAILDRERRYLQMHEQAALERAAANVNFLNVRDESPQGALWMLGKAKTHTPACLAAAGKVWSWRVLDKFSPAVHGGCRCTLVPIGQAIQNGWMHADQVPDDLGSDAEMKRAAAIAKHDHVILEAAEPEEIEEFVAEIMEAVDHYRLPKGAQHGGEFARRGDLGVPSARSFVRKALHKLVPHLPVTPAQRRRDGVGEWKEVLGHQVWVPEHRAWEREVAGRKMYSPPTTTEVYDRGAWMKRTAASVPVEQRERVTDTAQDTARMWEHQARGMAKEALAAQSPDKHPAEIGGHPKATHEGMIQAGFRQTRQQHGRTSVTNHYEHVSGAKAEVTYARGQVTHVGWTPGHEVLPHGPLLDRPPKNTDEFLKDVFNLAHALAEEHGNVPHMSRVEINSAMFDMSAQHDWGGVTQLGRDADPALRALFDAAGTKRRLTYSESRLVYALYRAASHEALHAAAPISQRDYSGDPVARALEEALTEELAAVEAVKMLRRQGLIDVLRWLKENPTDFKVEGNYSFYRSALSEIFDRAGLAPEKRENAIRILKFGFHPADRANGLASLVAEGGTAQHGPSMEDAREWVKGKLTHSDRRMESENPNALVFTPNVRADLSDVPLGEPVMVRGRPVHPGTSVMVRGREGTVQAILQRDDGPLFDVSYGTFGAGVGFDHGVHPEEIQAVNEQPEGVEYGAGAVSIGGVTFQPGDTVSYLNGISGRDTNGRTTATVERIVRTRNPSWSDGPEKGWQIEARTTDGEPVLLDAGRARGLRKEIVASPGGERDERNTAFARFGEVPENLEFEKRHQGEYASKDGRVEIFRLLDVNPPAWNVQWTTDYENVAVEHATRPAGGWSSDVSPTSLIVDGARTLKDARALAADEWSKIRDTVRAWETYPRVAPFIPVPAMMAADIIPTAWMVKHGYGEIVPQIGFRSVPYKPVPGGMEDKDALRVLHHFLTGSTDGWTGSRKQKDEVLARATERWKEEHPGWERVGRVIQSPGGERATFVDPNTIPVRTGLGPVTFSSRGDAVGPEYHATYTAHLGNGTPVGTLSASHLGGTAHIQMIEVPEKYRRQGVASALVQRVRSEGATQIETLGDVTTPEGRAFVAAGRQSHHAVEPQRSPERRVSEFVVPPKSGKLAAAAKETLGALDRTLRVPDLGEAIPMKATAGKNTRGGYVRAQIGDIKVEKWDGPTVRLARMTPAAWPAKRADELQPGDVLVQSGGYRARVVSVEREPKPGAFGRPREDGAEQVVAVVQRIDDKGEPWGDPVRGFALDQGDLVGFDWKPEVTGESVVKPGHIRISAVDVEESHSPESTIAHEIAHFIDSVAFHDPTGQSMESGRAMFRTLEPDTQAAILANAHAAGARGARQAKTIERWMAGDESPLAEWWRAVQATDAVEGLSSASLMEMATHKYLLLPHELFARSFAQWLAMRSGSPVLADWLHYAQNVPEEQEHTTEDYLGRPRTYMAKTPMHLRIRQWQDDDFSPVAEALDRMFESLGWRVS